MRVAELDYDFGEDDLVAFVDHHVRNAPAVLRGVNRTRWVLGVGFLAAAALFANISLPLAVVYFAFGATAAGLWPAYVRWRWKRSNLTQYRSHKNLATFGHTKLKLFEGALISSNSFSTSSFRTDAVERVEQSESHLFLYLGPFQALIIPRLRVHADKYREFVEELARCGLTAG